MSTTRRNLMFLTTAVLVGGGTVAFGPLRAQLAEPHAIGATTRSPDERATVHAEGRVATYPGLEITIATEIAGRLAELPFDEGASVKAGTLLARIDDRLESAAASEARAHIEEIDAELAFLDKEVLRNRQLSEHGAVAARAHDESVAKRAAAIARRKATVESHRRLAAARDKATITAPIDGTIIRRHVQPTEVVPTGAALYTLADLSKVRIEAEVDEFDLARVKEGANVRIGAEGFEGESWRGIVEEIPDAVLPRKLRPLDPGRPIDTRVLLVKIRIDEPTPLKLGQRVELVIER